MMDIIIFNVELGQCIFFYPRDNKDYALMVDCGNTPNFEPIDQIIKWNHLSYDPASKKYILPNLTLTNYDQDHFSGLPYLKAKAKIKSVNFPRNLTGDEIKKLKPDVTKAAEEVVDILDTYNTDLTDFNPPYEKHCYYLSKADFPDQKIDTNKLSQLVFVTYNGTRICIPGDLTATAWDKHLENKNVRILLQGTNIFVASHHGRENGYNESIFKYCKPEVIILSDKDIAHETQEGQTQTYGGNVIRNGIVFNGNTENPRKTLTTRSDGHLWIRIDENRNRIYYNLKI